MLWGVEKIHAIEMGADQIETLLPHIRDRRVGLIVNHTSTVGANQTHLLDTLISLNINVSLLFAPEHGFRGNADAGESVANGRDIKTGVEIVSLYGQNKRPSEELLSRVDVVVFDIQDVGARFYTYISTMFYAMESCTKYNCPFVVLDRPNPNDYVDGVMLNDEVKSFVGALPIPTLHGVTVAELALMIVGEQWGETKGLKLNVIPVKGWQHGQPYDLPIKPSPNLPNAQAVALYPSLCLFEATKVSVGRGTLTPFQVLGYPDKKYGTYSFTPQALEGFDKNPLQRDKVCYGVDLREVTPPKGFSLKYFIRFMQISGLGEGFISSPSFFDKLSGDKSLRQQLNSGVSEEEIRESWQPALSKYRRIRKKYLLYPDYL